MRLLLVIAFLTLTALPAAQMVFGIVNEKPVNENRRLAEPPDQNTPLGDLTRVTERWFGDHFGLRSLMIRVKAQIDYSVFGFSNRVLVGHDGQLFYRQSVNVEIPATERLVKERHDEILAGVQALADILETRGISLIVVVNQMCEKFYPELLPRDAARRPVPSTIDGLIFRLRRIDGIQFVDSEKIIRDEMKIRRTYHRTDFHWNDPAAYGVAKDIVDRISLSEGRDHSIWNHTLAIDERVESGQISTFMPIFYPPIETMLKVRQNWRWPSEFLTVSGGYFEETTTVAATENLLPGVVLVGDSYLDSILKNGFQTYFQTLSRLRWRSGLELSDIMSNIPSGTRYFILQWLEVDFAALLAISEFGKLTKDKMGKL